MEVELWAQIRRLKKVEGLSKRAIAARLRCCAKTIKKALQSSEPPRAARPRKRGSKLDPFKGKIKELLDRYPRMSGVRIMQEIVDCGYQGKSTILREHLKQVRPARKARTYLEVNYEPGEALQVDWGHCGKIKVGDSARRLSVFVAVLCFSRLLYIEFSLSQRKEDFYRGIVNALTFFGGATRKIIVDNLKAAVLEGAGRNARFHPEFSALCGHYLMEPVACQRRDPESKGRVEDAVKYVKHNCLAGRDDILTSIEAYRRHAVWWRDEVANVRVHGTTRKRPVDMFQQERPHLRDLPEIRFDTYIAVPVVASPMARVHFDCNKYSVPPDYARKALTLRADQTCVRIFHGAEEICRHMRSFEKTKIQVLPEHRKAALAQRKRMHMTAIEHEFDCLGPEARDFRLKLSRRPLKSIVHMRKILTLCRVYGNTEIVSAISRALEFDAIDAAYVENILHQHRRRSNLPSPTPLCPARKELLEDVNIEAPDPSEYDRLFAVE
jgi:transposase